MRIAKYALAVVAVLLAVACVVVVVSPTAVPGQSAAEKANARDLAVRVAATNVTKAFLDVDYRDMDPRIDKVLSLSTGTFKNQYDTAKVDLKTQAQTAKAVATGAVRYVGIGEALQYVHRTVGVDRALHHAVLLPVFEERARIDVRFGRILGRSLEKAVVLQRAPLSLGELRFHELGREVGRRRQED